RVEFESRRQYDALDVREEAPIVRLVREAVAARGRVCRTRSTGGASDANVWARRGLEVANLGCGMREIPPGNEWAHLKDGALTAEVVLETIRLHAASPRGDR